MSAERCGLGSLLPTSCRGRAEAFARRLQCRLRSLGTETDGDGQEPGTSNSSGQNEYDELLDCESWKPTSSTSNNMHEKQPIVSPNSDRFYDFDIDSNPGSPNNEEVIDVNNTDDLNNPFCESGCILASTSSVDIDSDNSDVQYYDPAWSDVFAEAFSAIVPQSHIKTESISSTDTITSQNSIINTQNNNNESHHDESDKIRKCIEQLCNDIIKEAEIEVCKIKLLQAQEKSPIVIISKADSIDIKPECSISKDLIIKSKDEISTLFDSLSLKEPIDDSQLSTPEEDFPRRVRRSSSLKSGKTPPGTPGRKKIVRFADVLGLDLADVRTYMDEIPRVPRSAFDDLIDLSRKSEISQTIPSKCLVPMFQQPGGSAEFLEKVKSNKVCLENAFQSESLSITGTVRVLNLDFHKSVYIRYTLDNWENFADLQATYVPCTSDFFSDKFSFVLYAHTLDIGQRIEFAIKYTTSGQQFWDSNNGVNYVFQCLNSTVPITAQNKIMTTNRDSNSPEDDSWASFY
jgi:protein phosphatase 1 regulatory subunit 3A/B/C/D/E